jgi:hypothetical protein
MPPATEVAALIVNETTKNIKGRDVIIQYQNTRTRRISENHPKLMAMQYPLLIHLWRRWIERKYTLHINRR